MARPKKRFVLSTEALGQRHWFAGTMHAPAMPSYFVCLSVEIFSAAQFVTEAKAQECLDDLKLTGFEIVPCEFNMSDAMRKGLKRSMDKALGREAL